MPVSSLNVQNGLFGFSEEPGIRKQPRGYISEMPSSYIHADKFGQGKTLLD